MGTDDGSIKSDAALTAAKRNLLLAKMLLDKYGVIHSFHTEQVQKYTVACCDYALSGMVAIYPEDKRVTYDIKTKRDYYIKKMKINARNKFSPMRPILHYYRYEKEVEIAVYNLKTWTRELLWPDTEIRITIDGEQVYGPTTAIVTEEE